MVRQEFEEILVRLAELESTEIEVKLDPKVNKVREVL